MSNIKGKKNFFLKEISKSTVTLLSLDLKGLRLIYFLEHLSFTVI